MDGYGQMFKSRYFYLFLSLIAFFTVSPLFVGNIFDYAMLSLLFSLIILFGIIAIYREKHLIILAFFLGLVSVIAYFIGNFFEPTREVYITHFTINISFLTVISYSAIHTVMKHKKITVDSVFGAICGYLLLGLTWTFVYSLIATLDPTAFSEPMLQHTYPERSQIFIYYSFVMLTTLGLGDITPVSVAARAWTWLEAVMGQIYLAVWISQIVGLHIVHKNSQP